MHLIKQKKCSISAVCSSCDSIYEKHVAKQWYKHVFLNLICNLMYLHVFVMLSINVMFKKYPIYFKIFYKLNLNDFIL